MRGLLIAIRAPLASARQYKTSYVQRRSRGFHRSVVGLDDPYLPGDRCEWSSVNQTGKPAERRNIGVVIIRSVIADHDRHFLKESGANPTHRFILRKALALETSECQCGLRRVVVSDLIKNRLAQGAFNFRTGAL
jgi:hypothetical protein